MKPGNPLSQLIIDYWYKAMLVFCTFLLTLALTVPLQGVSNTAVQLIALGGIFFSIGEWINHPRHTGLYLPGPSIHNGLKMTDFNREPQLLGNLFDILGFVLICLGAWKIISHL